MALFDDTQRRFARAVSRLVFVNPFLPERIEAEKQALGDDFDEASADWNLHAGSDRASPNIDRLTAGAASLAAEVCARIGHDGRRDEADLILYEDLVLFHLYHEVRPRMLLLVAGTPSRKKVALYDEFLGEFERFLRPDGRTLPSNHQPAHMFAIFCNLMRAFHHIFNNIIGTSIATVRLRGEVWQSIFTHDLRRYYHTMYDRMRDITCLVTGPSGTGKELVARAVGMSQYVPFDEASRSFQQNLRECFFPLNLSSLSTTLIESELFGHRKGSFTGASEDHVGWFEVCGRHGTVFLDEIGETDLGVQVKLLRVLQDRNFQRLGDTRSLLFEGKLIAATNRDLGREMQEGRFREDLYYRLCSDRIETRPLREQLANAPDELRKLVLFIATREIGEEGNTLAAEVMEVIAHTLGEAYAWPGNFRELEQCVRNVLVRRAYQPAGAARGLRQRLGDEVAKGTLTVDELVRRYCTLVYADTRNYEETARRLEMDRRTVKSKIDTDLLERLQAGD